MFLNEQIVVFTVVSPLLLMFAHVLPWTCAVDRCCLFAYQLPSKGTISIAPLIYFLRNAFNDVICVRKHIHFPTIK